MTRIQFIQQLRAALGNDLPGNIVEENVNFYEQYITDEIGSGNSEEEVLGILGDPWVLARTIVDAQDGTDKATVFEAGGTCSGYPGESSEKSCKETSVRFVGLDTWWKKLLLILGVVMIIVVVFSIITGLVSLLAPIVVPVIVIMLIIRVLSNRRS